MVRNYVSWITLLASKRLLNIQISPLTIDTHYRDSATGHIPKARRKTGIRTVITLRPFSNSIRVPAVSIRRLHLALCKSPDFDTFDNLFLPAIDWTIFLRMSGFWVFRHARRGATNSVVSLWAMVRWFPDRMVEYRESQQTNPPSVKLDPCDG